MKVGNKLIIITGASGSGKTTVSNYLHDNYGVLRVITHTTRLPRQGEQDKIDYYFETTASFAKNHYIESVDYAGHQYGSSREALQRAWRKRRVVSLVLDTKGAEAYVKVMPKQLIVLYVAITNPEILKSRLQKRGDTPQAIEQRLQSEEAQRDLAVPAGLKESAHVILNDSWAEAQQQVDQVLKKELMRR
ncbi:guanylate kinase [Lapidilactobacillus wuchangensis]|uniref:guanylate kinase n=1 Tax=Lapidilactobacillus wuchangensis TaxID=2486001 RepID=UPI000F7816C7|nr:AAA family ATPase [Lapidilactobacillus wuchangensis]